MTSLSATLLIPPAMVRAFDAGVADAGEFEPINVQDDGRNNYTEVGFLHVPKNDRFLGEHKEDDGRFSVPLKNLQGASAVERETFGGAKT